MWFKNRETTLALTLDTSIDYLSIALSDIINPIIYNYFHSLFYNFLLMTILCCAGLIIGLFACYLDTFSTNDEEDSSVDHELNLKTMKELPIQYWLMAMVQPTVMQSLVLQDIFSSSMFQDLWDLTNETAGRLIASPNFFIAGLCFFCGIVVYNIGKKPLICTKL